MKTRLGTSIPALAVLGLILALPIKAHATRLLSADIVDDIIEKLEASPGLHVIVDLDAQTVSTPDGATYSFDIDAYQKRCLQEGLDELGYTLTQMGQIEAFERDYAY